MDSLISIFMKFAALTQVIKIDDILGGALLQTKMKKNVGKKLKTQFKRHHMAEGERSQLMHSQKWNNVENHSHQVNPRLNSILL